MRGPSPAGPLMMEHRVIERLVAVLLAELDAIRDTGQADPVLIDRATDFIRTYADRCHHGKEEDILFRRLESKPLEGPLAALMHELTQDHVHGRSLTRQLSEANARYAWGDQSALPDVEGAMRTLAEFYPKHIEKEDRHFFKPCFEYFTEDERQQMLRDFHDFDAGLIHERYKKVVEDLEAAGRV